VRLQCSFKPDNFGPDLKDTGLYLASSTQLTQKTSLIPYAIKHQLIYEQLPKHSYRPYCDTFNFHAELRLMRTAWIPEAAAKLAGKT